MPRKVLTRRRSLVAKLTVLAMIASLLAIAVPASAAISTTTSCPSTIPSAGFTDLGGLDATTVTAINCLVAFGITQGTSATTYSPVLSVSRWQMALFLTRQAVDHGLTLGSGASQGFTDIGGLDAATQTAINQLKQLGITSGTSATTFEPNLVVSRWQMALFLVRLANAAGVVLPSGAAQGFTDIASLSAEAQLAINQAKQLGIADGFSATVFSPLTDTLRWQMALFLTRVLAADNVPAPAGTVVTVTPTVAATQAALTGRAFTATFKNADGTPYTGAVGITLRGFSTSAIQYDDTPASTSVLETVSDGLAVAGDTAEGFPGTDGVVTFVVRHVGAAETVVPIAWEDLNNDNDAEISGNNAPTEPFGLGGNTTFSAAAAVECAAGTAALAGAVTLVEKAADRFESGAGPCSVFYDAGDLFLIEGVASTLDAFEAALNVGDVISGTYDPDTADQSTLNIATDNVAAVTVTAPAAATSTTSGTYTVTGTGAVGYFVSIFTDADNNGAINGTDAEVVEGNVAAGGTWSLVVPLSSGVANNFTANQRELTGDANGTPVDVPTITQGTTPGVTILTSVGGNVGTAGILSPSDTVAITFSGAVTGVGSGDTITVLDIDGSTAVLTCATNVTCVMSVGDTVLTLTVTAVLVTTGNADGIETQATIQSVTGFTSGDGTAVNVSGSGAGRTFTGF